MLPALTSGCNDNLPAISAKPDTPGVPGPQTMAGWIGEDHPRGGALIAGIVPDGVATITLHHAAGEGDPARTITSTVVNDVAAFEVPRHTAHQDFPSDRVWRAADGHIIAVPGVRSSPPATAP